MSLRMIKTKEMTDDLKAQGWRTPQTYCGCFDEAGNFSAVYLFLLMDKETFSECAVAYVGMSKRLLSRWHGHNILPELEASPYWTQKWFKRVQPAKLREVEAEYIRRFDPPWNIIGRSRGVVFK